MAPLVDSPSNSYLIDLNKLSIRKANLDSLKQECMFRISVLF